MATLIPVLQSSNVEAAYEDMFKEITRKLYGEETGNGLHTLGTPVAQIATSGPTAPEGERSFTTLMSDRNITSTIEYQNHNINVGNTAPVITQNDPLTTAFGLAALMQQNGFTTTLNSQNVNLNKCSGSGTISNLNNSNGVSGNNLIANTSNTSSIVNNDQQRWISNTVNSTSTDVIVQWPNNCKITAFNLANQKSIKTTKSRELQQSVELCNNVSTETNIANQSNQQEQPQCTTNNLTTNSRKRKKSTSNIVNMTCNNATQQITFQKRYTCTHCPYSTDRRDLYTRHENIHKDEKPFQCYACLKQFNRADHVKKHFLRMHREMVYDINKTRRTTTSNNNQQQQQHQLQQHQLQQQQNVDQKPIIFGQQNNNHTNAFITQRNSIQETSSSLSIEQTIESVATAITAPVQMKQEKIPIDDKSTVAVKIKREKRFTCCYCSWSGADKWGLKRHLNTHTKPFVCMLCDYKAARSERLATHVLKVHNKKACNKCSYLADTQEEFQIHLNEVHPHEQRPSRNSNTNNNSNNNSNILKTIGNTLGSSNLINNFQNPSTSFGNNISNTTTNIPLQEIIVNPASMVGWRLSANGSLIPPNDSTGILTVGNMNQKRGAERLFQYLEADGSDPEDYTRQLKMDAISRNTASVAQDFHNAGGVNLKPQQQIFKNTCKLSKEAELLLLKNNKIIPTSLNKSNNILSSDYDRTDLINNSDSDQKKAMSAFLRNFHLQEITSKEEVTIIQNDHQNKQPLYKSPPANSCNQFNCNKISINSISTNCSRKRKNNNTVSKGHRLNLTSPHDKENTNQMFSLNNYDQISLQINSQFQNYVKETINKYYATDSTLIPLKSSTHSLSLLHSPKKQQKLTETEQYIEYLKNKEDITITITPKFQNEQISKFKNPSTLVRSPITIIKNTTDSMQPIQVNKVSTNPVISNGNANTYEVSKCGGVSRNRKQAQPKKIRTPKILMTLLRDKYMKKLVDRKYSCIKCSNKSKQSMLVFPYYTKGSLALHRIWKHSIQKAIKCNLCQKKFLKQYSLHIHKRIKHI